MNSKSYISKKKGAKRGENPQQPSQNAPRGTTSCLCSPASPQSWFLVQQEPFPPVSKAHTRHRRSKKRWTTENTKIASHDRFCCVLQFHGNQKLPCNKCCMKGAPEQPCPGWRPSRSTRTCFPLHNLSRCTRQRNPLAPVSAR